MDRRRWRAMRISTFKFQEATYYSTALPIQLELITSGLSATAELQQMPSPVIRTQVPEFIMYASQYGILPLVVIAETNGATASASIHRRFPAMLISLIHSAAPLTVLHSKVRLI